MKLTVLIYCLISVAVIVLLAGCGVAEERLAENESFSNNLVQEQEQILEFTPNLIATRCPTASMSGFGLALFNAINSERTQQGLWALAAHGCVIYVAQLRSDDMASRGYFSHTSPEGETAFSLLGSYGVAYGWAGENLARNNYPDDETVAVAIRDLMASEGHRANILSGNYTDLGVAVAFDGAGMKYYTMVFMGPP